MPSSAYGTWVQSIIVHVDASAEKCLSEALAVESFNIAGKPPRAYFRWHRAALRKYGTDEDVVFELSQLLSIHDIDWQIDWARSVY